MDSQIVRFHDLADKFLLLSASAKMWHQLLGHMACQEVSLDVPSSVAAEDFLVFSFG